MPAGPLDGAKRALRERMQELRSRATPVERESASRAVTDQVLGMPEFAVAARVALYAALPDEVSLAEVARAVWSGGRETLWPRIEAGGLVFAVARDFSELRPGRLGIPEPTTVALPLAPDDLVFAPGVAFDAAGGRLGRGRGYYDRALPRGAEAPPVFGVGFAFQIVEVVPMEPRDRRVDGVVSEHGVLRVAAHDSGFDPG